MAIKFANLSESNKRSVVETLHNLVSCLQSLFVSYQCAHWSTKGPNAYGNHLLFQRLYEEVEGLKDGMAEKYIGLTGLPIHPLRFNREVMLHTDRWVDAPTQEEGTRAAVTHALSCFENAYQKIKALNLMSLGLDDYIMSTCNQLETHVYMLGRALPPIEG